MCELLRRAEKNCVIVGNFNVPDIDWDGGTAGGRAKELLEAADDRLLEQLVSFPTHVRGNVMDLIFTDIPERMGEVSDEGRLGSSDHVMLTWTIVIKASPTPPQAKGLPDLRRADWDSMQSRI
jgi:Endonuclease-reverse transcriptase